MNILLTHQNTRRAFWRVSSSRSDWIFCLTGHIEQLHNKKHTMKFNNYQILKVEVVLLKFVTVLQPQNDNMSRCPLCYKCMKRLLTKVPL